MATESGNDEFKRIFKFYKRRNPPPDFSQVIDFSRTKDSRVLPYKLKVEEGNEVASLNGLLPASEWSAFTIKDKQGYQAAWVKRCLDDFPNPPNVTNLDNLPGVAKHQNIWNHSVKQWKDENLKGFEKTPVFKLRWATLGYHHDWNSKVYSHENIGRMPDDVNVLSKAVAKAVGYGDYSSEAAIINYYHLDSTLSGHTDHSELDHESPLISVSFGQPAVFLLGGPTRETEPHAMFINSGDIVVMWGPCRLSYHAVPRIMSPDPPGSLPPCLQPADKLAVMNSHIDETLAVINWEPYAAYLATSRINMNVRQVIPHVQQLDSPPSDPLSNSSTSKSS